MLDLVRIRSLFVVVCCLSVAACSSHTVVTDGGADGDAARVDTVSMDGLAGDTSDVPIATPRLFNPASLVAPRPPGRRKVLMVPSAKRRIADEFS